MELRQIRHFLAAVEHGSLGKAADALGITQAALSKSIKRLEDALRTRLLDRGPRGVRPTIFGENFASHARLIAVEARNAEADIEALRGAARGDIMVGVSPSIARHILPNAAARLLKHRPGLRIRIYSGMVDTLIDEIRNGNLDLVVSALPQQSEDPDLVQKLLFQNSVNVVAGDGHKLIVAPRVTLADLQRYDWILPVGAASARPALEQSFRALGLTIPRPKIETDSISFICSFLNLSDFISFLPHELVTAEDRSSRLRVIKVEGHTWERPVSVTYRRRTTQSPAAKMLLREVEKICRQI